MRFRVGLWVVALFGLLLVPARGARAQDRALSEAREFDACVSRQQAALANWMRLIRESEARTTSSDAALARDARESVQALLLRVREVRDALGACVRDADLPSAVSTVTERDEPTPREATVAAEGGTMGRAHSEERIASSVRVVRGERVDGTGSASLTAVQDAIRSAVGPGVQRCYDAYVDRVGARTGEVEFTFAMVNGQLREVRIEREPFDAIFRACAQGAVQRMHVGPTSGRVVFSYVLAVGR